jgi:phosphate starvation-inducible protein PhoH
MSKKRDRQSRKGNRYEAFLENALLANGEARANGPQRKKWSNHDLKTIRPKTDNQEEMFHAWQNCMHVCAYGTAGTGKTFLALYLAMREVFSASTPVDKIKIVRSVVPTRDVGFLPGDLEEKISVYEGPYRDICAELVGRDSTYDDMKAAGLIEFVSTSFIRGATWHDTVVIVDEGQNMSHHEINSVMTRLGDNTRLIFTGDLAQTDLRAEQTGISRFIDVVSRIPTFGVVKYGHRDIVRNDIVKQWIIANERYERELAVA